MKVDKSLYIPLYQQIKDYLQDKIDINEWEYGYRLPPEKELADRFNVSNITVKRAIKELVDEGYLYRQSGKGTFVIKEKEQDISKLVSFHNKQEEPATHPHRLLNFKKMSAGLKIAKQLNLSSSDLVYRIDRLKIEYGNYVAIEHSFMPVSTFPGLIASDINDNLLYNTLTNKYGVILSKTKVYFSTIFAQDYEAELLSISKGEQLFVFERYTTSKKGEIIEYSKFILQGNQANFFLEIEF